MPWSGASDYVLARVLREGTHERILAACRLQAGEWLPIDDPELDAGA